ncbi:TetR/AcrR family transcriptional regulator [Streptomyces sp. NEAU-YJ-81]|uniref:TetR/AcrR family transcriptional regulator n=1 Tax=Streptomyces sp. NEAU-YJ-81 TaxID=2820288 RepID=UPI001ABC52BB|nr:TetR family transcriptional regulator C-terminal domain-containing protein [Streptomyces sp. NEAU-YJ-81]MBO3678331.1 TetR family transcriptional regulator [Streptomyces sp. NEAU-YJ-81]
MGRRYDPERRQRIIDAAAAVVRERGITGLSHRAVAAAADVPLGSTTYHFATLDDLLVAALRQINAEWLAEVESWVEGVDPAAPPADELARWLEEQLTGDRTRMELEYELYFAALRHERLRPLAAECLDEMARMLTRLVRDAATARAVVALIDGLTLQVLLADRPYDREGTRAALARIMGGDGGDGPSGTGR